jgi:hypothetical protein
VSESGSDGAARVTELETKLREAEGALAQSREALDAAERRRTVERELAREGAVDVETAALLTEAAVAGMANADLRAAVAELKRAKPFLFRSPQPARSGSMAGAPADRPSTIDDAAAAARESGDRRVLLRYLRLKRGA